MGYVARSFGDKSQWNVEGGVNDTELSLINIKDTSTSSRIDAYVIDGSDRWDVVAYGQFERGPGVTNVAGLSSAMVTTLLVRLNGQSYETVEYAPGFDLIKWLTSYDYRYSLLNGTDEFYGSLDNPIYGDEVRGGAGNDHFTGYKDGVDEKGSANYDSFFGESGIDTAFYRGKLGDYQINLNAQIWDARYKIQTNGLSVSDKVSGRDGTDWLKDVERLDFTDLNLALDTGKGQVAGEAYRLYKAAFDRVPDEVGLGFWINALDNGVTLLSVAKDFNTSDEFKKLYGANVSDKDYLTKLYNNVLDRDPDQGGYDFWLNALSNGASRETLLIDFSESKENIANVAQLVVNGIQYQEYTG
jgi:hypothetical protein